MKHRDVREGHDRSYTSMHAALIGYARRLVDADTAEDLVQEAFVRVMESGRPDADSLPLSYFKTVVRNLAFDAYSRRTRDTNVAERSLITAASGDDGRAERDHSVFEMDLRERLGELSHRQWESLVMTVILGMTEHEAASAASVSRSAVTGGRDRALQWLRANMNMPARGSSHKLAG